MRTAAKTRSPEQLAKKIQSIIDAEQAYHNEILEDLARGDDFADTKVWIGKEAERVSDSGAPVVLTYDGAGYDYLSYQGEMEHMGGSGLRVKIQNAAAEMGYMTEDLNSWSMGFYPDETAEVYNPPKRELPAWLKQQLEEEFGSSEGKKEEEIDLRSVRLPSGRPEEQQHILREMKMSSARRVTAMTEFTIDEIADMLGIPKWDDFYERNYDYLAEQYYMPAYNEVERMYEEEGYDVDDPDVNEAASEAGLEALSEGEAEFYQEYVNAVESVANELGLQVGIEFEEVPRQGKFLVHFDESMDSREAAEAMRQVINGYGFVSIPPLDDFMEAEEYESYEEFVLDHISYISLIPEVYGEPSAERQFYDQMR